jgi:hypothetical protein
MSVIPAAFLISNTGTPACRKRGGGDRLSGTWVTLNG